MAIRDLLKKKDRIKAEGASEHVDKSAEPPTQASGLQAPPGFTFIRSTTSMNEVIEPPDHPTQAAHSPPIDGTTHEPRRRRISNLHFRKPSKSPSKSLASNDSDTESSANIDGTADRSRRISGRLERFHLSPRSRTVSQSSIHVPDNLPEINSGGADGSDAEAEWEKRALLLASKNAGEKDEEAAGSASIGLGDATADQNTIRPVRPKHVRAVSNPKADVDIQEAVRLHEAGDVERSTAMFSSLASPSGANSALAQVMYGLALRHGWGCDPSPTESLKYLSMAAANSAGVEAEALKAGSNKGGAAKGELVLAIFELANSFRNGQGCDKDPVAARRYYETAAELGDTDAMLEVAWCYLEGYGGKKDKFKAAQYLRKAERKGVKEAGNSWIWKEKYSPGPASASAR